jgi:hypothetical protein
LWLLLMLRMRMGLINGMMRPLIVMIVMLVPSNCLLMQRMRSPAEHLFPLTSTLLPLLMLHYCYTPVQSVQQGHD